MYTSFVAADSQTPRNIDQWSTTEAALLETLRLRVPQKSRKNADEDAALRLGSYLFFDPSLSIDDQIACSTCHRPELAFTDGLTRARGITPLSRNTPTLAGLERNRWFLWDGSADSAWSQALRTLESPNEMAGNRVDIVRHVLSEGRFLKALRDGFPSLPVVSLATLDRVAAAQADSATDDVSSFMDRFDIDLVFVAVGKSIARFVESITYRESRLDLYIDAVLKRDWDQARRAMSYREVAGLRVFIGGNSGCLTCHNGPTFSNGKFNNIGTLQGDNGVADMGRHLGIERLLKDPFNCRNWSERLRNAMSGFGLSKSDEQSLPASVLKRLNQYRENLNNDAACAHLVAPAAVEVSRLLKGAFKTPALRNVAATAPYMHDGRFATLEDVVSFYADPPDKSSVYHELPTPGRLDLNAQNSLVEFLRVLSP